MTSLLCVDSSSSWRERIGGIAARMGCDFLECGSRKDALLLLHGQTDIGSLVVAHRLDDGNGTQLIRNLRMLPHRVTLSVAFVMGDRNLALAHQALHAGATEVFLQNETAHLAECLAAWTARDDVPLTEGCVLLVEDSDSEAALIAHLLSVMGLTVHRAASVDAAQELLAEQAFQLAVIDVVLEGTKTGIALLKYLRHNLASRLPVLVISGHNDPSRRLNAIKSGADDFLEKPFVIEEFVWRAGRLLQSVALDGPDKTMPAIDSGQLPCGSDWNTLSAREVQIARHLLDGQSDKEIAARLGISYWTVRSHVQHVFDKLGIINRRELMVRYLRTGQ